MKKSGKNVEKARKLVEARPYKLGEAAEVLRAMAGLGDEDRELLLLVSWEELSPSEASKVLGISALAARSRLHRARRRLRALLEDTRSAGSLDTELDPRRQDEHA